MGDQQFEALSKYGQDLTAKAARLDPVIGRDEEIRRSVRILCRRTKNNPVLIGEPGKKIFFRPKRDSKYSPHNSSHPHWGYTALCILRFIN